MTSVCAVSGGRLIKVGVGSRIAPLYLAVQYDGQNWPTDLSAIGVAVGAELKQAVQAQFQNAMNANIFITPFGDIPGEITISFIANTMCDDPTQSGFGLIDHYLTHRLLPTKNKVPATISIAGAAFRAFLTAMQLSGSTSDTPIVTGTLRFAGWPI